MRQNAFAARAQPRTPLRELTALPQAGRSPSWILGRAEKGWNGKGYGRAGNGRGRMW